MLAAVLLTAAGGARPAAARGTSPARRTSPAAARPAQATAWTQPPPVLALPSRSGAEGPPRPYGSEPHPGPYPPRTPGALAREQSRALLNGPFPRGGLERGVSEGALLLGAPSPERALAMQLIAGTGASVVRIPVDWRSIAPASPPAGFDATDPASRAYDFVALDAAVRAARAAGLEPLLVVSHAPAFAEATNRWPYAYPGSWDPSPAALEAFAAALARRYDGSFPDPAVPGSALPRVTLLQAWNEPNLARYLEPQWVSSGGRWSAFSPRLYRSLLNGFWAGVKAVAPGDTVIAAGLAPNGDRAGVGRMAPLTFLHALLCVPEVRAAVALACPAPAHFDVLAIHPLSVGSPDAAAPSALDVAVSDLAKVKGVLAAAERRRTIRPAGPKPVWVTELNWEGGSAPTADAPGVRAPGTPSSAAPAPAAAGVAPSLQAAWVSRALHRLWVAGAGLVAWQFLMDPWPALRAASPTGGLVEYRRPAGLYAPGPGGSLQAAVPKPFLTGFALPFDPLRASPAKVRVWALARPAGGPPPASARALLEARRSGGRWRTVATIAIGRNGVINALVELRGAMSLRLSAGGLQSAVASVGAGRWSEAAGSRAARTRRRRGVSEAPLRRPSSRRAAAQARP